MYKHYRPLKKVNFEEGFTLTELIIVVVIVGILSAVGILIFSKQSQAAIKASVKSDVAANKSQIINDKPNSAKSSGLYIDPDDFAAKAVRTSDNIVGYTVSPDYTQACTWGAYEFSENDAFFYHFSSETGEMMEGKCDSNAGWTTVVLAADGTPGNSEDQLGNSDSNTPGNPAEGDNEEGGGMLPEKEEEQYGFSTSDDRLNINVQISTNAQNKICFTAEVSTESTTPVEWDIKIDRTIEPIRGNTFGTEITTHGQVNIQQESAVATITNKPHMAGTVVKGSPITVNNICIYGGSNPGNGSGMLRTAQQATLTPINSPTGGEWSASQSFEVEGLGTGEFWGIWEAEVEFTELANHASKTTGKVKTSNTGTFLTVEHISGNRYKVSLKDLPGNQALVVKGGEKANQVITFQKQ